MAAVTQTAGSEEAAEVYPNCLLSEVLNVPLNLQIHRIIEWPGLKRTTMIIEFQPPCYAQGCQPPDQAAQSHIQPGLECPRDGASTTSLGNLFQCVTTLYVKNFLLISNLNHSCLNLKPSLLVLSLFTLVNSRSPLFICSLQILEGHNEVSRAFSFLG